MQDPGDLTVVNMSSSMKVSEDKMQVRGGETNYKSILGSVTRHQAQPNTIPDILILKLSLKY